MSVATLPLTLKFRSQPSYWVVISPEMGPATIVRLPGPDRAAGTTGHELLALYVVVPLVAHVPRNALTPPPPASSAPPEELPLLLPLPEPPDELPLLLPELLPDEPPSPFDAPPAPGGAPVTVPPLHAAATRSIEPNAHAVDRFMSPLYASWKKHATAPDG